MRIIHIIDIQKCKGRIIIYIVIQSLRAQGKSRHRFIGVNTFILVVDHIFLKQIDNTIGKHFRVHTQILMATQGFQHRIRYRTDAHLQSALVFNQARHKMAHLVLHFAYFLTEIRLLHWILTIDHALEARRMN